MLQLSEIIKEVNNKILTESQESKSQSAAIKYLMHNKGMTKEEANQFVREDLRSAIKILRRSDAAKFTQGVTRMWCNNEFDIDDKEDCKTLEKVLFYVSSDAHINEYDRDLNGLSYNEIVNRFKGNVERGDAEEKEKLASLDYDEKSSDYDIVPIHSYEEASEYGDYVSWCVTHSSNMWNHYIGSDGSFYFCLKRGFQNIKPIVGDGCPLDEYGLSMIAVCIDENQDLKTCTCRWNHDHGGNDNIMSASELCENVLHVNFYDTFKPIDDVDRTLSYDDYIELCDENLIYVLGDIALSQDRDPYQNVFNFSNDPNVILHLYDLAYDNSSTIGGNSYYQDSVVLSREHYAILKNSKDTYDVVHPNEDNDNRPFSENYKIEEDLEFVTELGENQGVFGYERDNAILYTPKFGLSIINEYFDEIDQDNLKFTDCGNYGLLMVKDKFGINLFNCVSSKCILRNELPIDGDTFTISSDGFIHCQSGHIYDINGDRMDDDLSDLEIKYDLGNGIACVCNTSEYFGLYNTKTEKLITKVVFDDIKPIENLPFVFVEKDKKHNFINLKTFGIICPEWGDKAKYINDKFVALVNKVAYDEVVAIYDTYGNAIIPFEERALYKSVGKMDTKDDRFLFYYRKRGSNFLTLIDLTSNNVIINEDFGITCIHHFNDFDLNLYTLKKGYQGEYLYDPINNNMSDMFIEFASWKKNYFAENTEYDWYLFDINSLKTIPTYKFDDIKFNLKCPSVEKGKKANIIVSIENNVIQFFSKIWFDYISYYRDDYDRKLFSARIKNNDGSQTEFMGDLDSMTLTNTETNETASMLGESLIRKNCLEFKNKFDSIFKKLY